MKKQIQKWKDKNGFTLIEVLISTFIITIGLVGVLLFLTNAMAMTALSRDMGIATTHGELVLEEMNTKTSLGEIEDNDWDAFWGDFVTNNAVELLTNETITTAFQYPYPDLLTATVTVAWETKARDHTISFSTEFKR